MSCAFAATFAPISPVLLALRLTQGLGAAAAAWSRPPSSATASRAATWPKVAIADLHGLHGHAHHRPRRRRGTAAHRPVAVDLRVHGRPCDADQPLGLLPPARDAPPRIPPRAHVQVGYRRLRHRLHEPAGAVLRPCRHVPCSAPCSASCPRASRSSSTSSGSARSSRRLRGHGGNDGCRRSSIRASSSASACAS